ncbi:colicin immunity domain-containing protein [Paenarthrobacter sp. AMU7]|uniref:Colicin immunity domain-containing protein n=1 Tax=Paenarthrobacter sp. AMU7 TaxID=3162492 RepID=A0AB39YR65_9MICC
MTAFESDTPWWWTWDSSVAQYAVLLRLLVDGRVTADEFEALFLPLYKGDRTKWSEEIYEILDQLFYTVDGYNRDPALRDNDVDEKELTSRATLALGELGKVMPASDTSDHETIPGERDTIPNATSCLHSSPRVSDL